MAEVETEIELRLHPVYGWLSRVVGFPLVFIGHLCKSERIADFGAWAAYKIMKAGMRYKVGKKWKKVF